MVDKTPLGKALERGQAWGRTALQRLRSFAAGRRTHPDVYLLGELRPNRGDLRGGQAIAKHVLANASTCCYDSLANWQDTLSSCIQVPTSKFLNS